MKLKLLKRRFGVQAPRVAIRPQMPWYLRWGGIACGVIAAAGLTALAHHYGQSYSGTGSGHVETSQEQSSTQSVQTQPATAALKAELAAALRQLQIERAAQVDLAKQLKMLADENAQLREDIAILQTVSAPGSQTDGVSVSSVRVEPNPAPGEYTYRIVLVQTGARTKPFRGSYELIVHLDRDGVRTGMTIPDSAEKASGTYQLDFRVHQRIDGTFRVAPGSAVKSVQVRVFEGRQPQPKIMQTIAVS